MCRSRTGTCRSRGTRAGTTRAGDRFSGCGRHRNRRLARCRGRRGQRCAQHRGRLGPRWPRWPAGRLEGAGSARSKPRGVAWRAAPGCSLAVLLTLFATAGTAMAAVPLSASVPMISRCGERWSSVFSPGGATDVSQGWSEQRGRPLEPMRNESEPWKGDGNLGRNGSVALPGLCSSSLCYQGLRSRCSLHPWLPSVAPPGLKSNTQQAKTRHFPSRLPCRGFFPSCSLCSSRSPRSRRPRHRPSPRSRITLLVTRSQSPRAAKCYSSTRTKVRWSAHRWRLPGASQRSRSTRAGSGSRSHTAKRARTVRWIFIRSNPPPPTQRS